MEHPEVEEAKTTPKPVSRQSKSRQSKSREASVERKKEEILPPSNRDRDPHHQVVSENTPVPAASLPLPTTNEKPYGNTIPVDNNPAFDDDEDNIFPVYQFSLSNSTLKSGAKKEQKPHGLYTPVPIAENEFRREHSSDHPLAGGAGTHSLTGLLTHSLTGLLTHSLAYSLTHSLT